MYNKKILFLAIIFTVLFALFLSNYMMNRKFIENYRKGIFELSNGDIMAFTEPSIAPYNRGDIFYKKGMLPEAEEEYKKALEERHSDEQDCSIRINLALSIAMDIDPENVTAENIDETIRRLEEAKGYLLENGWAHDEDENGKDADAQQLKDDIDKFIEELKNQVEQQQGQGNEGNPNNSQDNKDQGDPSDKDNKDDKTTENQDQQPQEQKEQTQEEKDKEKINELQRRSEEERKKDIVPDKENGYGGSSQDRIW